MIRGIGIDQVRVDRMRDLLARWPERVRRRLFRESERSRCEQASDPATCYAARFAAKEAFVKALGTGLRNGMAWTDLEVTVDPLGRPSLRCEGAAARQLESIGGENVHATLTHDGAYAIAAVVIEGRPADG